MGGPQTVTEYLEASPPKYLYIRAEPNQLTSKEAWIQPDSPCQLCGRISDNLNRDAACFLRLLRDRVSPKQWSAYLITSDESVVGTLQDAWAAQGCRCVAAVRQTDHPLLFFRAEGDWAWVDKADLIVFTAESASAEDTDKLVERMKNTWQKLKSAREVLQDEILKKKATPMRSQQQFLRWVMCDALLRGCMPKGSEAHQCVVVVGGPGEGTGIKGVVDELDGAVQLHFVGQVQDLDGLVPHLTKYVPLHELSEIFVRSLREYDKLLGKTAGSEGNAQ